MNLFAISLRNLRVRVLSTALTTISIAAGAGLLAVIWLMIDQTEKRYRSSLAGYSAVVGPQEGAPLNIVLNTVFHIGAAPGLVPFKVYQEMRSPRARNRFTLRSVIPQARGDQYGGFAIIGTTDEMFVKSDEEFFPFARGRDKETDEPLTLRFADGGPWSFTHDDLVAFAEKKAALSATARASGDPTMSAQPPIDPVQKAAVLGATVARRLGLGLGDTITPVHGEESDPAAHEHDEATCEVVGILEETGSPIDRAIYIPLSTFLSLEGHESIRPNQEAVADNIGLNALILDTAAAINAMRLRYEFQTRSDAQVAWPGIEISKLLQIVGNVTLLLEVVSQVVLLVAAISILVALYNTMNERRREIAIMRSLGARRWQILQIILQEAVLIPLVGAALGVLVGHGAVWVFGDWISDNSGIPIDWAAFSRDEIYLVLGAGVLGGFAGLLPAIKGSLTPVASNLNPTS